MQELFITSSCKIENNRIIKNNEIIFDDKNILLDEFLLNAYQHLQISYPRFYKLDNLCKLGLLASEVLLNDEQISERYNPEDIGIVFSNENASLDTDIHYTKTIDEIPSPALFVYTLPNIVIGEISIKNNFKGENTFFISKQFDTAFIYKYVKALFVSNDLQACICGWIEILNEAYKCVLHLVEKDKNNSSFPFSIENLETIFSNA